jgi:hypothetical protein
MPNLCVQCFLPLDEDSVVCARCGAPVSDSPAGAEPLPPVRPANIPANALDGINGWLILPAIGLAFSPVAMLFHIGMNVFVMVQSSYGFVTAKNPALAVLLRTEIILDIVLIAIVFVLNYLFWAKKKIFPKALIALLSVNLLLGIGDHLATVAVMPGADRTNGMILVSRAIVIAAIWIPYFLKSERVRQTFIH